MNKLFYLLPYWSLKHFLEVLSRMQISISTRNSILFNYFKLFKSDLDLTITSSSKYPNAYAIIADRTLRYLPYVKEINQHYEENLKFVELINPFEAYRQKILTPKKSNNIDSIESYVFLLRMLQGNSNKLLFKQLDQHSIEKWNFYFAITLKNKINISENRNIVDLITKIYPPFSNQLSTILEVLNQSNLTTREKFHAFIFKREAKILFPHIFTSIAFDFNFDNEDEEMIYISQMAWEVFGLSTQILHLKNDLETVKHLKNIKYQLKNATFQSLYVEQKSKSILNLLESINHYLLLE